jgi:hypothetical protein
MLSCMRKHVDIRYGVEGYRNATFSGKAHIIGFQVQNNLDVPRPGFVESFLAMRYFDFNVFGNADFQKLAFLHC